MSPSIHRWSVSAVLIAVILANGLPHRAFGQEAAVPAGDQVTAEQVRKSIERAVAFLKRQQNANGRWSDSDVQPGGITALCTLALLNAGVSVEDESIQRALKVLRAQMPSQTYSASLNTMVLAIAEPAKDAQSIARNVRWLEQAQIQEGPRKGSWTYGNSNIHAGDNSNTQFAVLALHEAERAGVKVSDTTWRLSYAYWQSAQNNDSSWGYQKVGERSVSPGTGSMTCAGLTSLIISAGRMNDGDAKIVGGEVQCCGEQASNKPVEQAIKWLGRTFTVQNNPSTMANAGRDWLFYYLYGVERVGRITGQRFFVGRDGKHDWYREGAEKFVRLQDPTTGAWKGPNMVERDPQIGTALALLFMSKGRRPVLIGKLQYGDDSGWNRHRADVANLTNYVEVKWKKDFPIGLSWQTVDLRLASVEDLLQAPVLFLNGSGAPQISDEQARRLRDYLDRGGFIFAEATCPDAKGFDTGFRALMVQVFADKPEHKLKLITAEHPVWYAEEQVEAAQQRPLLGIDYGCRTCVIYAPPPRPEDPAGNLSCYWELSSGREQKIPPKVAAEIAGANAIGINVLAYATNRELKSKEETFRIPTNQVGGGPVGRSVLSIAKLKHPGGCDSAPGALPSMLRAVERETKLKVIAPEQPIEITSPALFENHLVFMHGRSSFRLTVKEREQLRKYLSDERGGTLLVDAICANRGFADALRREMQAIFPDQKLEPIPASHEMLTDKFGGYNLANVARREPQARGEGDRAESKIRRGPPELEGIRVGPDGRFAVIFSKYDISCALEKHDSLECEGYLRDDAERIAVNMLLYSLLQ